MAATAVGADRWPPTFAAVVGDKPEEVEEEQKRDAGRDVEAGTSAGAATATTTLATPNFSFCTSRCAKSFTALFVGYIAVMAAGIVFASYVRNVRREGAFVTLDLVRSSCR